MNGEPRKIRLIMELRRQGIGDTAVLSAIERIPREAFVPAPFRDQTYENRALPIGRGQTLSQPQVVATMTQALKVERGHKVLEIGTGSGYQTAVLSRLCRRVYTVERFRDLLQEAERRFAALRLYNITVRVADGGNGWPEQAPFGRILVTAAAPKIPEALADQLDEGGIMVLPVGKAGREQDLIRVVRGDGRFLEERIASVRFVPLVDGVASAAEMVRIAGPKRPSLA